MSRGKAVPPSLKARYTPQWWARYWAFKRRAEIRRRLWLRSFEELGDLYGAHWEIEEARRIREDCEEQGLPMGYGRVGQTPEQLSWGIALSSGEPYDADMADEVTVTVVDDAEVPPEKVAELASEVSKWERGDVRDGTWKDTPEAIIAQPGKTVVVRRRVKNTL